MPGTTRASESRRCTKPTSRSRGVGGEGGVACVTGRSAVASAALVARPASRSRTAALSSCASNSLACCHRRPVRGVWWVVGVYEQCKVVGVEGEGVHASQHGGAEGRHAPAARASFRAATVAERGAAPMPHTAQLRLFPLQLLPPQQLLNQPALHDSLKSQTRRHHSSQ